MPFLLILLSLILPLVSTSLQAQAPSLFVSLGSHCEVAQQLRKNNLREAAYPFDWILTLDHPGFLKSIKEDFALFLAPPVLLPLKSPALPYPAGNVINTYYHIDFRHDWHDWPERRFKQLLPSVQAKYKRRIERFNALQQAKGKIYFIRAAFDLASDPLKIIYTVTDHCHLIKAHQARQLREVLQQKFPSLNFHLIVINYTDADWPLLPAMRRIKEYRIRKTDKDEDYKKLLDQLNLNTSSTYLF